MQYKPMKYKRGFTLIELLVVIAIIGILSAVVLASLNSARTKGNDAGVKANLATVSTQAALFLDNNGNSYDVFDDGAGGPETCPVPGDIGDAVFHDSTVQNAIAAALLDASAGGTAVCVSDGESYAVSVSRPAEIAAGTSNYWCVDHAGARCGINDQITGPSCGSCVTSQ
jgi:prepilin-type N-terminal cleavage/methylation domain-containing protein